MQEEEEVLLGVIQRTRTFRTQIRAAFRLLRKAVYWIRGHGMIPPISTLHIRTKRLEVYLSWVSIQNGTTPSKRMTTFLPLTSLGHTARCQYAVSTLGVGYPLSRSSRQACLVDSNQVKGIIDEYTLTKQLGPEKAKTTLEKHYAQFINKQSFEDIQAAGFRPCTDPLLLLGCHDVSWRPLCVSSFVAVSPPRN